MTRSINTAPFWLDPDDPEYFPDVELALTEPDGLLAVGGDLSIQRLTAAYRQGVFPWYSEGQLIMWWSPNPRALLFLNELNISRSLRKSIRRDDYQISFDQHFNSVVNACATSRKDGLGTWIVDDMKQAYNKLHEHGLAHSVEVFRNNELVGGLYGVSIGACFFGESMFSRQNDMSKVALVYLARHLQKWNFPFIDCQVYSDHLGTLGAREVDRTDFIKMLDKYCKQPTHKGHWHCVLTAEDVLINHE